MCCMFFLFRYFLAVLCFSEVEKLGAFMKLMKTLCLCLFSTDKDFKC